MVVLVMTGCASGALERPVGPAAEPIPLPDVPPGESGDRAQSPDPQPARADSLQAVRQAERPRAPPAGGGASTSGVGAAHVATPTDRVTPYPAGIDAARAAPASPPSDEPTPPEPGLSPVSWPPQRWVVRGEIGPPGDKTARPPGLTGADEPRRDVVEDAGSDDELPGPGTNADLVVQIIEANRVVPPGGTMNVQYVLYSAEGNPGRVRLRVDAPEGWLILDGAGEERPLEAWQILDEELRIAVPAAAAPGQSHVLRLIAELIGEPGTTEALTPVQILSGGAVNTGDRYLAGTTTLGVSGLPTTELQGGDVVGTVDLSGKLSEKTRVSVAFRQGPQESFTNYRYRQDETYVRAGVQHDGWQLKLGSRISSQGDPLTGPSVSGNGLLLSKMNGRLFGEAVLARPTTFTGEAGGHLWRAAMGVRLSGGTIGVTLSDFARPDGGYTTLAPELDPTLDPDSLDMLERERELSAGATSTRVRGLGVEANFRIARAHRLLLRAGGLEVAAVGREEVRSPSLEAQYSFSARRAFLNTRFRRMPPAVEGVYLPGNEVSVDGNLRVIGPVRLTARAYRYENEKLGEATGFEVKGSSLGLRFADDRWRLDVRGYHRTLDYSTRSVRRTGQVVVGLALGPWSLSTTSEIGRETSTGGSQPFRSHRGDLRVKGDPGYASLAVRSYESGVLGSRLRADLLGAATLGGFELAGGAWATRGWTPGGEPGAWMHVGVPLSGQFTALVGFERWARESSPWRVSLGVRKGLILPVPFLGADGSVRRPGWPAPEEESSDGSARTNSTPRGGPTR